MRTLAGVLVAVLLTAAPLSAQAVGLHVGPAVSWVDEFDNDDAFRFGFFAGVSVEYDVRGDEDGDIRTGLFYIQKGSGGCCGPRHFVEASVLYKFGIDDISYVLVGATVGQRLDSTWDEIRYFSTPVAAPAVGHQLGSSWEWEDRLDLGAVAVFGIELSRSERLTTMLEVGFNYSILVDDRANRTATLGLRFQR